MNEPVEMDEIEVLRVELKVLRDSHRDLDAKIHALQEKQAADMLTLSRLKREKLALKDKIARLEDRITPDIIA